MSLIRARNSFIHTIPHTRNKFIARWVDSTSSSTCHRPPMPPRIVIMTDKQSPPPPPPAAADPTACHPIITTICILLRFRIVNATLHAVRASLSVAIWQTGCGSECVTLITECVPCVQIQMNNQCTNPRSLLSFVFNIRTRPMSGNSPVTHWRVPPSAQFNQSIDN